MNRTAAVALLLLVSCGPSRPQDPYLGATTYRVLEADRVDAPELILEFRIIHKQVEDCLGVERDHDDLEFFRVVGLVAIDHEGKWRHPLGLYTIEKRIYLLWGLNVLNRRQAVAHEIGHYITRLGHPEIDPELTRCGIPLTITLVPA